MTLRFFVLLVDRADGSSEKYLVPLAEVPMTSNSAFYEYGDKLLNLNPGDIVTFEGLNNRLSQYESSTPFPLGTSSRTSSFFSALSETDKDK